MAKNTMDALRDHLFETIEMLKNNSDPDADPKEKIDLETAKRISEAAQVIVNSVKIEVDFLQVVSKSENRQSVLKLANESKMLPHFELTEEGDK